MNRNDVYPQSHFTDLRCKDEKNDFGDLSPNIILKSLLLPTLYPLLYHCQQLSREEEIEEKEYFK